MQIARKDQTVTKEFNLCKQARSINLGGFGQFDYAGSWELGLRAAKIGKGCTSSIQMELSPTAFADFAFRTNAKLSEGRFVGFTDGLAVHRIEIFVYRLD